MIGTLVSVGLTIARWLASACVFIALAIEGSRLVARIERWRAFVGEPVRPAPTPIGRCAAASSTILRAEFADESRWRDVLYVAINLPLSIIEFFVAALVWTLALSLLTMPIWYDAADGASLPGFLGPLSSHDAPVVVLRTALGAALLPVAASLSQLLMALHRASRRGPALHDREPRAAAPGGDAPEEPVGRDRRRSERAAPHRARPPRRRPAAARDADDRPWAWPASGSTRIRRAAKQLILEGQEQAREALAEIRHLVRGVAPSILLDRGLVPALASITGRGPVPTVLVSDLAAGRAASARHGADGLLRRHRGPGQRRQAQRRPALRGALQAGGVAAGRRGLG